MLPLPTPIVIKKLPSTFLCLCLCTSSLALAADKPAAAPAKSAAVKDASEESSRRIAAETTAAIEALGANPGVRQISTIVFKAVRNSPASVLQIVYAAARVSPQIAVPEIVTAATAAVPNPWKQVTYRHLAALDAKKSAPDFKGGPDGKRSVDFKGGPSAKGPAEAEGTQMPLAEAIARAASEAQPGLALPSLMAAVDIALLTDPSLLIQRIQGPRANSGVGDAGGSNYANEPLRPGVAGSSPVPTPNAPAVSQ